MTVRRGLTANERSIIFCLAIGAMAERTGSDVEAAEDQLNQYAIEIEGDNREVILSVAGQIFIRAPRQWLSEISDER